jgi:hypothetical protein
MTKTQDYDIVGSYNNQRVSSIDAERSVNLFQYNDALGKKPKTLINTSGLINTESSFPGGAGGFRRQFLFGTDYYSVIGNAVYKTNMNGDITILGMLSGTLGTFVGIDANTYQIIFVDGAKGYIYDTITGVYEQITDPAFPAKPIDVTFLDGFFVVANGGTNQFQLSSFNQGLVWGPDNTGTLATFSMGTTTANIVITYATGFSIANYQVGTPIQFSGGSIPAEFVANQFYYIKSIVSSTPTTVTVTVSATDGGSAITSTLGGSGNVTTTGQLQLGEITTHPGNIVACRTLHRRLFLFSTFYTEVWENAGIGTTLPFRRNNSLLMEYGTPAIGSISVGFDMMIFLSQTRDGLGSVMQVVGTQSIPISTRALDFQLSQYAAQGQPNGQIADCAGFLIKENGLIFYRMNFTLADHTFVYCVTQSNPETDETKFWHEEEVLNGDRHPAQTHVYVNGINYVGHYALPILYILDSNTFTNDNEAIRRMRITKAIVPPGYQRIRIDRLQIDLLQGNIADYIQTFNELDLLTENGDVILTEGGTNIELEQESSVSNPEKLDVFLSISKDGGQTYGYKVGAPMGNIGQRTYRTLWRKLGVIPRGQAFVTKFEFFQDVPFIVLGASWAYEVLPE